MNRGSWALAGTTVTVAGCFYEISGSFSLERFSSRVNDFALACCSSTEFRDF